MSRRTEYRGAIQHLCKALVDVPCGGQILVDSAPTSPRPCLPLLCPLLSMSSCERCMRDVGLCMHLACAVFLLQAAWGVAVYQRRGCVNASKPQLDGETDDSTHAGPCRQNFQRYQLSAGRAAAEGARTAGFFGAEVRG